MEPCVGDGQADMHRKNKKGKTVYQVLQAGSSYTHFAYLRNGNHIANALSPADRALLAWGTTANEAVHFQINRAQHTVLQQHMETAPPKFRAFCLGKMLAHHSAAYHPTAAQRSQAKLIHMMVGCIMHTARDSVIPPTYSPVTMRSSLTAAVHKLDKPKAARRQATAAKQAARWLKHVSTRASKKKRRTKRVVFTKEKAKTLRRAGKAGDACLAARLAQCVKERM